MIKKLLLVLCVIALSLCLFSCEKDREYDEGEVLAAASELIPKSAVINEMFWGIGIPTAETVQEEERGYRDADTAYLASLGIHTIEDIKNMTLLVYDKGFSKSIFSTKLSPLQDEEGYYISYARYIQSEKKDEAGNIIYGPIKVYLDATVLFDQPVTYHTDTLRVEGVKGQIVTVSLDVTVIDKEGVEHTQRMTVQMFEEEYGWRLSSPTYAKYTK